MPLQYICAYILIWCPHRASGIRLMVFHSMLSNSNRNDWRFQLTFIVIDSSIDVLTKHFMPLLFSKSSTKQLINSHKSNEMKRKTVKSSLIQYNWIELLFLRIIIRKLHFNKREFRSHNLTNWWIIEMADRKCGVRPIEFQCTRPCMDQNFCHVNNVHLVLMCL